MPATAKEDFVKAFNIFITESNIKTLISLKKRRSDGEKVYLLSELGRKDVDLKKEMLSWNEMRLGFAGNLNSFCQCLWKQAKDAGTFCPAIKKSHSWDSNSKCLKEKRTSQSQPQSVLSFFFSLSHVQIYGPHRSNGLAESCSREQRPTVALPSMAAVREHIFLWDQLAALYFCPVAQHSTMSTAFGSRRHSPKQ